MAKLSVMKASRTCNLHMGDDEVTSFQMNFGSTSWTSAQLLCDVEILHLETLETVKLNRNQHSTNKVCIYIYMSYFYIEYRGISFPSCHCFFFAASVISCDSVSCSFLSLFSGTSMFSRSSEAQIGWANIPP